MKTCVKCKVEKTLDAFSLDKSKKDGLMSYCRKCNTEKANLWMISNPDKAKIIRVDHVKPLVAFDLTDQKQFKEAVHFTNLQPLWAYANCSKKAICQ